MMHSRYWSMGSARWWRLGPEQAGRAPSVENECAVGHASENVGKPTPRMVQQGATADRRARCSLLLRAGDEVGLAQLRARLAQDHVGGGAVEVEIRDHEAEQVVLALEVHLAVAHLQVDVAALAAVDLLGLEALDVIDHALDARVELLEGRLVVLERG